MSLASHAISRLKELWKKNYDRNSMLNARRFAYSSAIRKSASANLLEQLEPRLMMSATTTVFYEGFEDVSTFLNQWSCSTSQNKQWFPSTQKAYSGSRSAFASVEYLSDNTYVNNQNNYMRTNPQVNLSGYDGATLVFRYWQNTESGGDGLRVNIEGNTEWLDDDGGTGGSWREASVDLTGQCGNSAVDIMFNFFSNSSYVPSGISGAWVDEVKVLAWNNDEPDLEASVNVTPEPLKWGDNFSCETTIRNTGNGPVDKTTTAKYYLSSNSTISSSDYYLGSYSVGTMTESGSRTWTKSLTLPNTPPSGFTDTGTLYIGVIADATGVVDESDEGNNTDYDSVSVTAETLPTISISDASIVEGDSGTQYCEFTVTLSKSSNNPVTVNYATSSQTASSSSDYTSKTGQITIPAGVTSYPISVSIHGDSIVESDETFIMTLGSPSGATISDGTATGTILNDDVATPSGLSASDGTYNDKIQISWNNISGEDGYDVYRNTSNDSSTATKIGSVGADTTTMADSNVAAGTTYYYWVKSFVVANGQKYQSEFSSVNSGYVMDSVPDRPTNVSATTDLSDKICITWDEVTGATSYDIYRFEEFSSSPDGNLTSFHTTGTSYDDTSAIAGIYYTYYVVANNSAGSSNYSAYVYGHRIEVGNHKPNTPTGISPTDNATDVGIVITFKGSAFSDPDAGDTIQASQWEFLEAGQAVGSLNEDKTEFTLLPAFPSIWYGETHTWRVRYQDNHGTWSDWSDYQTFTTQAQPITSVSATDGVYDNKVHVSWGSVSGATSYIVHRYLWNDGSNTSPTSLNQILTKFETSNAYFDDTTAVPEVEYAYIIEAIMPDGSSYTSDFDMGYKEAATIVPSAPTNVSASDGTYEDRVRISWTASSGATGYEVWRGTSTNSSSAIKITSSDVTGTGYDDTTATAGITYYYFVKAKNSGGTSELSSADSGYKFESQNDDRIEFDARGRLTYQDADGDNVTITIKGGGDGYVLLPGDTGDALGIFLSDTTAKTLLSFSVKPDRINGGTGYTTIGGIEADGLIKSIKGKTVNLEGEITLNGDGDFVGAKDSVSITLAAVEDSLIDTNGLPIKSLTLADWADTDATHDTINAPWIGSISVKGQKDNRKTWNVDESLDGDFDATLFLSGADKKDYALSKCSAKGVWSGGIAAGDPTVSYFTDKYVGSITAGVWNGVICAGYLKSLTTKPVKNSDINGDASGEIWITGTDSKGNAIGKITIKGLACDLDIDAGDGVVGNVTVGEWWGGSLTAGVVKSIKTKADKHRDDVNGNLGIDITVDSTWYNSQENFRASKTSVGKILVANNIESGSWNIIGDLGSVTAKGEAYSLLMNVINGDAKSLTFGGLFDSEIDIDGELKKVAVKGWKVPRGEEIPTFTWGSTISADYIKSASLTNWDTEDMTQIRVPTPGDILGLKYKDTENKSNSFSWKFGKLEPWDEAIEPIEYVG